MWLPTRHLIISLVGRHPSRHLCLDLTPVAILGHHPRLSYLHPCLQAVIALAASLIADHQLVVARRQLVLASVASRPFGLLAVVACFARTALSLVVGRPCHPCYQLLVFAVSAFH
jgi:hypothetical protein